MLQTRPIPKSSSRSPHSEKFRRHMVIVFHQFRTAILVSWFLHLNIILGLWELPSIWDQSGRPTIPPHSPALLKSEVAYRCWASCPAFRKFWGHFIRPHAPFLSLHFVIFLLHFPLHSATVCRWWFIMSTTETLHTAWF